MFERGHTPWNKGKEGYTNSGSFKKGHRGMKGKENPRYGKKPSEKVSKAVIKANKKRFGVKSPHWKGDTVGYSGLHRWVYKELGDADTCEHCGKDGLSGCQIHWANISGEYLREKGDWIRLCAKCHYEYDGIMVGSKKEQL